VEIDEIPVLEAVRQSFPKKHQEFVLSGGEDYQILFAAPPDVCKEVMPLLSGAAIVGSIVKGSPGNVTVNSDSGEKLSGRSGWDHFFTTTDS
jgi:thiamine monophosphate kinase